jgi:hypothetical protein
LKDIDPLVTVVQHFISCCIEAGASLTEPDNRGRSPLHHLASQCWGDILEFVLEFSNGNIDITDYYGATLLHYAAFANDKKSVLNLLKKGCNPSIRDKQNRTAFDLAALFGFGDITTVLQPHSSADSRAFSNVFQSKSYSKQPGMTREEFFASIKGMIEDNNFYATCDALLASPALGSFKHQPEELQNEIVRIQQTMTCFISRLIDAYHQLNPEYQLEHILRGSMAEGTRSGPPNEFDVLLVSEDEIPFQGVCKALHEVLKQIDVWTTTPFDFVSFITKGPRAKLEVLYTGPAYKYLTIAVDLVPAFRGKSQ